MNTTDLLPSWNHTAIRQKITDFVRSASTPGNPCFVPEEERIAVIDFDGTLALENRGIALPGWVEIELFRHLILDRCRDADPACPALDTLRRYDRYTLETVHEKTVPFDDGVYWDLYFKLIAYAVEGLTIGETCDLLSKQLHKTYIDGKNFYQALFKPMVELAGYLMQNGFGFFIVSGSNRSAIFTVARDLLRTGDRPFPYHHCIGADLVLKPRTDGNGRIRMEQVTDYVGINMRFDKCENIARQIGRIPVFALGNSMGDFEMLKWTAENPRYPSLSIMLLHDDDVREFSYNSEKMRAVALENGWEILSMKEDLGELYLP
jgi:hypothetical protein